MPFYKSDLISKSLTVSNNLRVQGKMVRFHHGPAAVFGLLKNIGLNFVTAENIQREDNF